MEGKQVADIITSVLQEIRRSGGPIAELSPPQSLDKVDNGAFWFTIGMESEQYRRVLTLRFGRALEVLLPGDAYERTCRPQIVRAILSFWDGLNPAPSNAVDIEADSPSLSEVMPSRSSQAGT